MNRMFVVRSVTVVRSNIIAVWLAVLVLCAMPLSRAESASSDLVRVKADRVILRLQPSFRADVIAQVGEGTTLTRVGSEGTWVQVLPPPEVVFWVHSDFVGKDGTITGARVRMRSSPSVDAPPVHALERGERVDVKGKEGAWSKVAPPKGMVLWVHETLIEQLPDEAPARESRAVAALPRSPEQEQPRERSRPAAAPRQPEKPAARQAKPVAKPELPAATDASEARSRAAAGQDSIPIHLEKLGLVPLPGQGARLRYEGTLKKAGLFSKSPVRYRLTVRADGRETTLCFVMGNNKQLASLTGQEMGMIGRSYWLKGAEYPLLVLEHIVVPGEQDELAP